MTVANRNIRLAIVIPYYKLIFFEETLKSLSLQSDRRFNLYIGNDGSAEDPTDLMNEYLKDLNVEYRVYENIGYEHLSKHWDRCISMTQNEPWVQILGDDDVLHPKFVERFYETIEDLPEDINIINFNKRIINEDSEEFINFSPLYSTGTIDSKQMYLDRLNDLCSVTLSENIFRKSTYQLLGFVDMPVAFGTDFIMILEFSHFKSIYHVEDKLVDVRVSAYNLSNVDDEFIDKRRKEGNFLYRRYLLRKHTERFSFKEKMLMLSGIKRCLVKKIFDINGVKQLGDILRYSIK